MVFLLSLILAFIFSWFCSKAIKKHSRIFYIGAVVLSLLVIGITYSGLNSSFPSWVQSYVWPIFANCAFATALFVVVMMIGALPNGSHYGSAAIKRLMPIRAELSIMASILTLGHNIGYGKTYFIMLFTAPERLSGNLRWAAICSLVMIVIMLPLMITSFPGIRKKMNPKSWKRLQRAAYVFYALIYLHVMLLNQTLLAAGQKKYLFNILLYTAVFAAYAAMRIRKALLKRKAPAAKAIPAIVTAVALVAAALICVPSLLPKASSSQAIDADTTDAGTEVNTAKYQSGTYQGTGMGFRGSVTLSVTVSENKIEAIEAVESGDDEPFWSNALVLTDTIIAKQSADVDTVTGATFSSKGIIEAVSNALAEAMGEDIETSAVFETEPVPETETESVETEAAPVETEPEPIETEPEPIETEPTPAETEPAPIETEPTPVETEPAPVETEPAPVETEPTPAETEPTPIETAPAPAETEPAAQYKDGAYFGNGTGYNGAVQVAVMISDGSISSVVVISKADDQDFWNKALGVIDDVIEAQSAEVDTVSGATYSSKGLLEAIADALEQAKN